MPELAQSSTKVVKIGPALSRAFRVLSLACALLVVMIHVPVDMSVSAGLWTSRIFNSGICGMAVPFFFFAAGFFLAGHCEGQGWWWREVAKRCKSLLIPYVVFAVAYAAVMCGLVLYSSNLYDSTHTQAENIAYVTNPLNILGMIPADRPVLRLLWFVRGLFVFVVVSPLIWLAVKGRMGFGFLLLALGCVFGARIMLRVGFPPKYANVFGMGIFPLIGLFHFSTGMFLRTQKRILDTILFVPAVSLTVGGVILALNIFVRQAWTAQLLGSIGNLALYLGWLALLVKHSISISDLLLSCAFPVYLIHRFLLLPIRLLFKVLTDCAKIPWCWYLVVSVILFAASVGLVLLMRRFIPKTSKVIFGGR